MEQVAEVDPIEVAQIDQGVLLVARRTRHDRLGFRLRRGGNRPTKNATALGQDSVGSKPQEEHDEDTDSDPFECWHQGGVRHGGQETGDLFEAERNEESPEDGALVVAGAAHDDGGEEDDRLGVRPSSRRPQVDEADQDGAAQRGYGATEDHHRGSLDPQILPERVGDHVVVAHRAKRATVG